MNIIKFLKEKIKKSLKEIQENTDKQQKEMNKTVKDLKFGNRINKENSN